jgi:hypothetical protein
MYMRMLVTVISSWRPGFSPMVVHMEYKAFWSVMGQIFLWAFCFPLPVIIPPMLHVDLSSVGGGWYSRPWYERTRSNRIPDRIWFCETWRSRSSLRADTVHVWNISCAMNVFRNWRNAEDGDQGGYPTVPKYALDRWQNFINVTPYEHNQ